MVSSYDNKTLVPPCRKRGNVCLLPLVFCVRPSSDFSHPRAPFRDRDLAAVDLEGNVGNPSSKQRTLMVSAASPERADARWARGMTSGDGEVNRYCAAR